MRSVPIRRRRPRLRPLRTTTTTTTHPRQRKHTTLSKTSPGWPRGVFISYLVTKPPCPLALYRRYVTNGSLSRFPYPITSQGGAGAGGGESDALRHPCPLAHRLHRATSESASLSSSAIPVPIVNPSPPPGSTNESCRNQGGRKHKGDTAVRRVGGGSAGLNDCAQRARIHTQGDLRGAGVVYLFRV